MKKIRKEQDSQLKDELLYDMILKLRKEKIRSIKNY